MTLAQAQNRLDRKDEHGDMCAASGVESCIDESGEAFGDTNNIPKREEENDHSTTCGKGPSTSRAEVSIMRQPNAYVLVIA